MKKQLLMLVLIVGVNHLQGAEGTGQNEKSLSLKQAYKEGYHAAQLKQKAQIEKMVKELARMMLDAQPGFIFTQDGRTVLSGPSASEEYAQQQELLSEEMRLAEEVRLGALADLYQ